MSSSLDSKWRRIEYIGGIVPKPRHGHRAAVVNNDMMLVFGGGNEGIVDELHVFKMCKFLS